MLCFEIWVNNEKLVIAGQDKLLSLTADVVFSRGSTDQYLNVIGTVWEQGMDATESYWRMPHLKINDEVKIKIVENDSPDPPSHEEICGIKTPPPWRGEEDRCSFCGGDSKHRKKLFEGVGVKICAECVDFYHGIAAKLPKKDT